MGDQENDYCGDGPSIPVVCKCGIYNETAAGKVCGLCLGLIYPPKPLRDGEPDYFSHPKRILALEVALGDAAQNLQSCFKEFDRQGLHGFAQYSLAWKEDAFKAYCACPRCVVRGVECGSHCDHGIYDPICPHCKEDPA